MITVYTYANCDTCRRAVKWLRAHKLAFVEKPIRETPPSLSELRAMAAWQGGEIRRLFNVSGLDYRALGLKDKLADMSETGALTLLASNGNLVKRPFLIAGKTGLVGFDEAAWKKSLV